MLGWGSPMPASLHSPYFSCHLVDSWTEWAFFVAGGAGGKGSRMMVHLSLGWRVAEWSGLGACLLGAR